MTNGIDWPFKIMLCGFVSEMATNVYVSVDGGTSVPTQSLPVCAELYAKFLRMFSAESDETFNISSRNSLVSVLVGICETEAMVSTTSLSARVNLRNRRKYWRKYRRLIGGVTGRLEGS